MNATKMRAGGAVLGLLLLAATPAAWAAKVMVLISNGSEPFMEAMKGFQQTATFEYQTVVLESAQLAGITSQSASCVVAIGPQAASACNALPADVPVVYSMVLNPASLGKRRTGGVVIRVGLDDQFGRIKKFFPDKKRIGVLYNPVYSDETIRESRKLVEKYGLTLSPIAISKDAEVAGALAKYTRDSVDILWMIVDPTLVNPTVVKQFIVHSLEKNLPLIGLSVFHVKAGALMAFSPDYVDIGSQTAQCVPRVISGESAHEGPRTIVVYVNAKTQRDLGIRDLSAFAEVKLVH